MKLTRISDVRAILRDWNIRPQKSLGQNFLIDANILGIMLAASGVTTDDSVLEIGAGLGVLTEPLARAARRVVTVEKDPRLWPLLKERLRAFPNVELICGDMMKVDHENLFRSGISKVVANLPYSVGSAILANLVRAATPPARFTVTLQKEVAARLAAGPGRKEFSLLTLWAQLRYDVVIRKTVNPTCFYPAPGVGSAILNLVRREPPGETTAPALSGRGPGLDLPADDSQARHFFYALTKFAFARRRKQLKTILCDAVIAICSANKVRLAAGGVCAVFRELGINPRARPEDLSVEQWRRLALALQDQRGDC